MEIKEDKNNKINNLKNISSNNNINHISKKIEERQNKYNGLTSHELLKIVKQTSDFPKNLSANIPLETLVYFYDRYWNDDLTDDESDTS